MERHFHVSQAFIPLGGQRAAVAVAPPSADPDGVPRLDAIRAFLLDGSKGYVLHQGTWHSLDRFPLHPPDARFVMLTDHETQADLTAAYRAGKPAALTQEVDLEPCSARRSARARTIQQRREGGYSMASLRDSNSCTVKFSFPVPLCRVCPW
jgi:hypothetical protein